MDVIAINELKKQVIDQFSDLCKKLGNGYSINCYQDILLKIMLLEDHCSIKDYKKYLYTYI